MRPTETQTKWAGEPLHGELVQRAAKWLVKSKRCLRVMTERCAGGYGEAPDAIGWLPNTRSILIECKTTLGDFYSDRGKPWRRGPTAGVGAYRYYLTPRGLIDPQRHTLPDDWGLLEVRGQVIRCIVPATYREQRDFRREIKLLIQGGPAMGPSREITNNGI